MRVRRRPAQDPRTGAQDAIGNDRGVVGHAKDLLVDLCPCWCRDLARLALATAGDVYMYGLVVVLTSDRDVVVHVLELGVAGAIGDLAGSVRVDQCC